MELSELTVSSFANLLGSDAPAPGGGSAAALEGSLGAALASMVSALTLGRKKYEDSQALAQQGFDRGTELMNELLVAMDHDTAVFNEFSAAMAMPKETDEQKALRSETMQKALVKCTESPFHVMELCVQALELTDSLLGKTNASALSDLGVSALSLGAGLRGAWLNVLINIGSLKDRAAADHFRSSGKALLDRGMELSEEIYRKVEAAL